MFHPSTTSPFWKHTFAMLETLGPVANQAAVVATIPAASVVSTPEVAVVELLAVAVEETPATDEILTVPF